MRLGFVGVGRWGQKLAEAFRACGAEIVAYDRKNATSGMNGEPPSGVCGGGICTQPLGTERQFHDVLCERRATRSAEDSAAWRPSEFNVYMPWRKQLADKSIDAIIAVAPPEITTHVALACATAGKPVCATKPLWDHPTNPTAPFYCDLWRLWSKSHETARELIAKDKSASVCICLYGNGPFRSFPGAFDWGPHAVAAVLDLFPGCRVSGAAKINQGAGETFRVHIDTGTTRQVTLYIGNAQEGPTERAYMVGDWSETEEGSRIGTEEKSDVVQRFAQSFLDDIAEGFVSRRTLDLSRDGMAALNRIREMAT